MIFLQGLCSAEWCQLDVALAHVNNRTPIETQLGPPPTMLNVASLSRAFRINKMFIIVAYRCTNAKQLFTYHTWSCSEWYTRNRSTESIKITRITPTRCIIINDNACCRNYRYFQLGHIYKQCDIYLCIQATVPR